MPLKKQKVNDAHLDDNDDSDNTSNSHSSDNSDTDTDSDADHGEIVIDFVARGLVESDHDTITLLMKQKLGSFPIDLNEIATILTQQENVGNVIYQAPEEGEEELSEDEQTIFGVISCINFSSPQAQKFVTNFKQFLIRECQKHNPKEVVTKFEELLRTKRISYLVNERYMNIPPAISVPMFESLRKDLQDESEKDENNNNLKSEYWLLVSRHYVEQEEMTQNLIYGNAEEEVLEEFSELKFEIRSGAQKKIRNEFDNDMVQVINVVMVAHDSIDKCLDKIKALCDKPKI